MSPHGLTNGFTKAVEDFYKTHAPHGDKVELTGRTSSITQVVLQWVGKGHRVVDLGCHKGTLSAAVREGRERCVGGQTFPSIADLARSAENLAAIGHDLNTPLPLPNDRFDLAPAISVLDFLPGDLAFLRECYRIVQQGGTLIVVVPNQVGLGSRLKALMGRSGRDFCNPDGHHTFHRYSLHGIKTLIEMVGFSD